MHSAQSTHQVNVESIKEIPAVSPILNLALYDQLTLMVCGQKRIGPILRRNMYLALLILAVSLFKHIKHNSDSHSNLPMQTNP